MTVKLELPHDDYEGVYQRLDKTRKTSATVTLPKAAVVVLLRDHHRMITKIRELGERVTDLQGRDA